MATKKLPHLAWLQSISQPIATADGKKVEAFELSIDASDKKAISEWARWFREHYCLDGDIEILREGSSKSRAEFLLDSVFPSKTSKLGPAIRAGDFAEILIADILENRFGLWVPRTRYATKSVRDESTKGSDVIGFRFHLASEEWDGRDVLSLWESKTQLAGNKPLAKLQEAVGHSVKDALRKSESLHAAKRKLMQEGRMKDVARIARFQDPLARPYVEHSGAAATFCSSVFDAKSISETDCSTHPNAGNLALIVVHSAMLMAFVHSFYDLAANEA